MLRVGSRNSKLAIIQAEQAIKYIKKHHNIDTQLILISTTGDRIKDVKLSDIGGKKLFVKELEEALMNNIIDIAVHSLKDVPGDINEEFFIDCYLPRANPYDVFISNHLQSIYEINSIHKIGTSSVRRQKFLEKFLSQPQIVNIRGNVDTRLNKLDDGVVDGLILAAAGIERLNLQHKITQTLDMLIPAVGQGCIAIECLKSNHDVIKLLSSINHLNTSICIGAERAFLYHMNGDCHTAMGALAYIENNRIHLKAGYFNGDEYIESHDTDILVNNEVLGQKLAEKIINKITNN